MLAYLQITQGGLFIGSLYGFAAIGLQFILGTTKKVHLTYGHICLLSALITSSLLGRFEFSPIILIPGLALAFSYFGWLAHPGPLFSKPKWGATQRPFLLVSLGFALVFEDIGSYIWALPSCSLYSSATSLRLGELLIPLTKLVSFVLCFSGALLLSIFVKKSLLGKAFRAWETAESKIALLGVDQAGMGKKAMAIGFGFAGLAGAFFALSYSVSIHEGLDMTIKALCLAVIAGTLSPLRVLGLGLLMGVGESWIGMLIGSQWSPVLSYTIFLFILKMRR
jgi:branched-chain amino acid transport system permease protein